MFKIIHNISILPQVIYSESKSESHNAVHIFTSNFFLFQADQAVAVGSSAQ